MVTLFGQKSQQLYKCFVILLMEKLINVGETESFKKIWHVEKVDIDGILLLRAGPVRWSGRNVPARLADAEVDCRAAS